MIFVFYSLMAICYIGAIALMLAVRVSTEKWKESSPLQP